MMKQEIEYTYYCGNCRETRGGVGYDKPSRCGKCDSIWIRIDRAEPRAAKSVRPGA